MHVLTLVTHTADREPWQPPPDWQPPSERPHGTCRQCGRSWKSNSSDWLVAYPPGSTGLTINAHVSEDCDGKMLSGDLDNHTFPTGTRVFGHETYNEDHADVKSGSHCWLNGLYAFSQTVSVTYRTTNARLFDMRPIFVALESPNHSMLISRPSTCCTTG